MRPSVQAASTAGSPAPSEQARTWETSLNIAIEEMKDFRNVAPVQELYSEFTTAEGRVLFEQQGLVKDTGIDLMDCPLDITLKLRVRRRMPQGAIVLYHVVLPLPLISRHLLSHPHEWLTWLGLLPNTINLDQHPPDVMFTQSVHLISRPDIPKLRLRFRYHNPELQAQLMAKMEREEQESRQRKDMNQSVGKKAFEDLQNLMQTVRGPPAATRSVTASGGTLQQVQPQAADDRTVETPVANRDALMAALRFIGSVRDLLAGFQVHDPPNGGSAPSALPPPLNSAEVLTAAEPGHLLDAHCIALGRRLWAVMQATAHGANGAGTADCEPQLAEATARGADSAGAAESEPKLVEGLRMALMGMLEDSEGGKVPRTSTNLSNASAEQMTFIQASYPKLWEVYREVSTLAKDRAGLCEERAQWLETSRRMQEDNFTLQQEVMAQRQSLELAQQTESMKQFEKLLAQQRQMQQLSFDKEVGTLRHQLEEVQREKRERDAEVKRLRAQLEECKKQQQL